MNKTNFEHALIAVILQLIIFIIVGNIWVASAFSAAIFIGREISQAEYRYISLYNKGKREGIPLLAGLSPKVWNKLDPWLDWVAPSASVIIVSLCWLFL